VQQKEVKREGRRAVEVGKNFGGKRSALNRKKKIFPSENGTKKKRMQKD